jgi:predicted nucleic acid-binding protein
MICFFDTSALIKKYINELGTELVRLRLQSTSVVVSSVAKIECISVISRLKVSGKAECLSVIDPNETQP